MDLNFILNEFVSRLVQAKKEKFTGHEVANLFRQDLKEAIELIVKENHQFFEVKASVGAGNWASIPWVSILNPAITSTTQDGVYPVYLFNADGSGFYLSLNQGTTTPTRNLGRKKAEIKSQLIKKILLDRFPKLKSWGVQDIDLKAETTLGKSYEKPNISAKFYACASIPESDELIKDLEDLLAIYKEVEGFSFDQLLEEHQELNGLPFAQKTLLPKPFLLLAGISGTGKTRFVREQAKNAGQFDETYCLTSVRPDWHEPSDLLGYLSRLNGTAEYIMTDVLQFIAKAWCGIVNSGLTIEAPDIQGQGKRLVVTGEAEILSQVLPYWLCLDEMNLAPVEQYFADYLSVLETREWNWDGDSFIYSSDALLKPATINAVADKDAFRCALGFAKSEYDALWQFVCQYGLGIPFNLMVAGTVNMDETTHGFSRKVIDRALSFDFGAFFPNHYDEFFSPTSRNKRLSYPTWSHATQAGLANTLDSDGEQTIVFLTAVNAVLKNTPFELAYRALNELLLAVICNQPQDDLALKAVWDDFMMCKVLPRIEGDSDKLSSADGKNILVELDTVLAMQLAPIWDANDKNTPDKQRPDLYREHIVADSSTDEAKVLRIPCRSKEKLAWMTHRLESATFTSFWP